MIEGLGDGGLKRAILITAGVVIAGALLLAIFGVGAQLTQSRRVAIVVRVDQIPPEVASQIRVGDPAFTDVAGVLIGQVTKVDSRPEPRTTTDSAGGVHLSQDLTNRQVDVTIEGDGRVGAGLVIIHSQAILAGRPFSLISHHYYLAGTLVSVHVR